MTCEHEFYLPRGCIALTPRSVTVKIKCGKCGVDKMTVLSTHENSMGVWE